MRRLVKRIPGASSTYHHGRMLLGLVYEGFLADRTRLYDRLLANGAWDFEKPSCQERYLLTLEMARRHSSGGKLGQVLELGCGVGLFTAMLAEHSDRVLATDISAVACDRTRSHCARANVQVAQLDLLRDPIPGRYDAVIAMDVLELLHGPSRLRALFTRLSDAVAPGGMLVITMSRLPEQMRRSWWARRLLEGADCMFAFLDGRYGLELAERQDMPRYSLAVFRRAARAAAGA